METTETVVTPRETSALSADLAEARDALSAILHRYRGILQPTYLGRDAWEVPPPKIANTNAKIHKAAQLLADAAADCAALEG